MRERAEKTCVRYSVLTAPHAQTVEYSFKSLFQVREGECTGLPNTEDLKNFLPVPSF